MKGRAGLSLTLVLALVLGQAVAAEPAPTLTTIPSLDVPRYLGQWHEIAKFPNRFQQKCVADTSARYEALGPGRIRVVNRCRLADGSFDEAVGEARQIGEADSPRLKVRFAPAWLSFLPAVWGDYWVIELSPAYDLVAVSEPRREYLWILSRTPIVEASRLSPLLERLSRAGFDTSRLEWNRQGEVAAPK